MQLRDSRNTGRPVPFGLPKGADTDTLFASIAGAAAELLEQQPKATPQPNAIKQPGNRPASPDRPRR